MADNRKQRWDRDDRPRPHCPDCRGSRFGDDAVEQAVNRVVEFGGQVDAIMKVAMAVTGWMRKPPREVTTPKTDGAVQ